MAREKKTEIDLDKMLTKVQQWFEDWEEATQDARINAQRDRDYYDTIQHDDEYKREMNLRGQPVLTFNRIGPKIDYLLGDEILKRIDPKCVPRTPAHEDGAQAATDSLRYLDDDQRIDRIRSMVWDNMIVEGHGGGLWEVARAVDAQGNKLDEVELKARNVPWNRIWYDPHSNLPDYSDARYMGLFQWMDIEEAREFYPDTDEAVWKQTEAKSANLMAGDTTEDKPSNWMSNDRKRIAVFECYYKQPGDNWYVCHFVGGGFTRKPAPTDIVDTKGRHVCMLVLERYRVNKDNESYGAVRRMISPQDEINKRRSKALHRLSTKQVVADEGAVPNPEEARMELARPDGWVTKTPGLELQVVPNQDLTQVELGMLQEAKEEIESVGPSINPLSSPDASGRAQMMRLKAASVPLEPGMDNLRDWTKRFYTVAWYGVRQYWNYQKWLRVTDDSEENKGYRFVGLNQPMPRVQRLQELIEKGVKPAQAVGMLGDAALSGTFSQLMQAVGQQMQGAPPEEIEKQALAGLMSLPTMQETIVANQVDQLDMDISIEEVPDTASIEQEEYEGLISLAGTGVQLPPNFVELVIEASSLRAKKKLLEMLRQGPSPEQQQAQQQAQRVQMAQASAEVDKTQAAAHKDHATATKTEAETQLLPIQAEREKAAAVVDAARAGQMSQPDMVVMMPGGARRQSGGSTSSR